LHRHPETDGVLDVCRQLGVTLIAYMPPASRALTGKYSSTIRPAGWRRYTGYVRGRNLAVLTGLVELLREVGSRSDMSPAQVALRWLIQQDGVLPIPGAKYADQASHNAGALTFSLEEAETDALDRATSGAGR
jgi:aryl-alcohol dehydrogenase-like predicted oxidoreductase